MKHSKIFRVLAMAVILSLLVVALPVSPALASYDYDIDLVDSDGDSLDEGEIGDYFYVEGDDWPPSDYVEPQDIEEVDIYFSSEEADTGDDIDDEVQNYERLKSGVEIDDDGEFDKKVKVPDELTDGDDDEVVVRGTYYVYVTMAGSDDIKAVAEFTVIAAGITLDTEEGPVGTEVEITGFDFADNEEITVEYDGDEISIEGGDDETDRNGAFEAIILVPDSAAGEHTIKVTDESDNEAETVLTVESEITINPESGIAGERVTVRGTGFADVEDVTIKFDGDEIATGDTNIDGSFTIPFDVPAVGAGTYDVEAEDDDNNSAEAEFTIASNISIGPVTNQTSPGYVGMDITISGKGFKPNATITITYASTPVVFTTTSAADGSFSYTFKAPKSEAGEHTITATDGVNSMEAKFYMEADAPAIPKPLLPLMDSKPEQPIFFDWEDVTDPSGVTYILQIAKDESFTTLVLQEELTDSEYTLSEEVELESTKKDAPYWWRVKAIDGADNESRWTGAGSFHVGFSFSLPNWAKYLLWTLGGLALFFVGFFVGRRTGYSY